MKFYVDPEMEILFLSSEDVIATSSNMGPGKNLDGSWGDGDQGEEDIFGD